MTKSPIVLLFVFFISVSVAQRTKKNKPVKEVAISNIVVASLGKMQAELAKNIFFIALESEKPIKDTIQLKVYGEKIIPTNCILKSFTSKGKTLHYINWVDIYQKNSTLIQEVTTITNTVIFDAISKTKIFSNAQKSTAITEKHFLDVKQTVSETIDRKRNEGLVFALLSNGDINLKSKNQSSNLTYDLKSNAFVAFNKK